MAPTRCCGGATTPPPFTHSQDLDWSQSGRCLLQSPRVTHLELLQALVELAQVTELEVRTLEPTRGTRLEFGVASAACRVRGEVWVVLSATDPVNVRIDVLAAALKAHRTDWLEQHWLPPAVRERLS